MLVDDVASAGVSQYGENEGRDVWMLHGQRLKKTGEVVRRRATADTSHKYEILERRG